MSEETEMDLQNAISDDMANISQAMRSRTPLQLAEAARHAKGSKVAGIRDWVMAGRPITARQLWVLAEYYVYHAEAEAEAAMDDLKGRQEGRRPHSSPNWSKGGGFKKKAK